MRSRSLRRVLIQVTLVVTGGAGADALRAGLALILSRVVQVTTAPWSVVAVLTLMVAPEMTP